MTTTNTAAAEALAYLETQGFTRTGARLWDVWLTNAPRAVFAASITTATA